jgi:hypothetical protein
MDISTERCELLVYICIYVHVSISLKMQAGGSSDILANIYQTTWHHIPKGSSLHG